jgi:hypothetical protein
VKKAMKKLHRWHFDFQPTPSLPLPYIIILSLLFDNNIEGGGTEVGVEDEGK